MAIEGRESGPPELSSSNGRRRAPARLIALLCVALIAAGFLLVQHLGVRPPAWYPPCWFHEVTGLHCPGCGTARAMHALAQGMLLRALDQNVFAIAILPVLGVWAVNALRRAWTTGRFSSALSGGWATLVLIVVVIFAVLRNLPWWPFVLLAPD